MSKLIDDAAPAEPAPADDLCASNGVCVGRVALREQAARIAAQQAEIDRLQEAAGTASDVLLQAEDFARAETIRAALAEARCKELEREIDKGSKLADAVREYFSDESGTAALSIIRMRRVLKEYDERA